MCDADCDVTVQSAADTKTGIITSPNYPNRYGPNLRCLYYLIGQPNERVQIFFEDFEVKGVLPRYSAWFGLAVVVASTTACFCFNHCRVRAEMGSLNLRVKLNICEENETEFKSSFTSPRPRPNSVCLRRRLVL